MGMRPAEWIWCGERQPNTYCCVRGQLELPASPVRGTIHITADSRYQFWVNGAYIGQGPTPFRRPVLYLDQFDITSHLRVGKNIISVLGNYHGVNHCTYTLGVPGIVARIEVADVEGRCHEAFTGRGWKVRRLDAYERDVPRRNGATSWMECYDARRELVGWRAVEFDDSTWADAEIVDAGSIKLHPRIVPSLKEYYEAPVTVAGAWRTQCGQYPLSDLTLRLDEEPLEPAAKITSLPITLESDDGGMAITVDFGREVAGQIELDVDAPEGVVIDLCPAENLRFGRPWCFRKRTNYAKRYITRAGRQQWRCAGYDGMRYVHAVVRGPHPRVVFHRLGVWRRETSLPVRATFECDDPRVNRIWQITCHTITIGTQDVHVDCPTREQTSAWGDHVWSGLWSMYMTGDASHLKHLVLSSEYVQWPCGQVPCYSFSGVDSFPLYDYSLICVMGMWIYFEVTEDREVARQLVPVADRILDWYRNEIGPSGLIEIDGHEAMLAEKGQLFIDHPGLGTHNHTHPGLDRRGISAGLNFFFILSLEAQANLLTHLGEVQRAQALRGEAAILRTAAEGLFYNPQKGAYIDNFYRDKQSEQVSQQINALAVLSRTCPSDRVQSVLGRVLESNDGDLCLCGTYFWTYLSAALCQAGMHREMWHEVVRLWNEMAEKGATSWWETFLGDDLDSLCHIWSCVPGYLILAEVLGVKPDLPGFSRIAVRPRVDLLFRAQGRVPIPNGQIEVRWQDISAGRKCLNVRNLSSSPAIVQPPPGWVFCPKDETQIALAPFACAEIGVMERSK